MITDTVVGPTQTLLLQRHRSLLLRIVISEVTHRTINVVIVLLTLLNLMTGAMPYVPVASVCLAAFIGALWHVEQRFLAARLAAVEKALTRRGSIEGEDAYITYRFESSTTAVRSWVLRFEPLLWVMATAVNAVLSLVIYFRPNP